MHTYNLIPADDIKEHLQFGTYCHCNPLVVWEGQDKIIRHNAYDGRELFRDEFEMEDVLVSIISQRGN